MWFPAESVALVLYRIEAFPVLEKSYADSLTALNLSEKATSNAEARIRALEAQGKVFSDLRQSDKVDADKRALRLAVAVGGGGLVVGIGGGLALAGLAKSDSTLQIIGAILAGVGVGGAIIFYLTGK